MPLKLLLQDDPSGIWTHVSQVSRVKINSLRQPWLSYSCLYISLIVVALRSISYCLVVEPPWLAPVQQQNHLNLKFLNKNLKLGTLKSTCELHKPERNRMRIAANCILTLSAVFWSAPWAVTIVTVVHCTFAPAETRTWGLCTCLYSCMYSCVVTAHRSGLDAHMGWKLALPVYH